MRLLRLNVIPFEIRIPGEASCILFWIERHRPFPDACFLNIKTLDFCLESNSLDTSLELLGDCFFEIAVTRPPFDFDLTG